MFAQKSVGVAQLALGFQRKCSSRSYGFGMSVRGASSGSSDVAFLNWNLHTLYSGLSALNVLQMFFMSIKVKVKPFLLMKIYHCMYIPKATFQLLYPFCIVRCLDHFILFCSKQPVLMHTFVCNYAITSSG